MNSKQLEKFAQTFGDAIFEKALQVETTNELGLDKVEVRECEYGKGVFALEDIPEATLLCFYPQHLRYTEEDKMVKEYGCGMKESIEFMENLYGEDNPDDKEYHMEKIFEEIMKRKNYSQKCGKGASIIGLKEIHNRPFIGHMINSPITKELLYKIRNKQCHTLAEKKELWNDYIKCVNKRSNVICEALNGGIMFFYSIRKIPKGGELLYSYGLDYWRYTDDDGERINIGELLATGGIQNGISRKREDWEGMKWKVKARARNFVFLKAWKAFNKLERNGFLHTHVYEDKPTTTPWIRGVNVNVNLTKQCVENLQEHMYKCYRFNKPYGFVEGNHSPSPNALKEIMDYIHNMMVENEELNSIKMMN